MKRILIPLAPVLKRLRALPLGVFLGRAGAEVITAGIVENPIEGRNKIKVLADTSLDSLKDHDFDMIVLPGGAVGTENLKNDARVKEIVERLHKKGKLVTAICAAPTVLSAIGITAGRTITSHPTVRTKLQREKLSE